MYKRENSAPGATDAELVEKERKRLEKIWFSINTVSNPPEDIEVFRKWEWYLTRSFGLDAKSHEKVLDGIAAGRQPTALR